MNRLTSPKISVTADGRFRIQYLTKRVLIVEALGQDWFDWGNETEEKPAFVAYYGAENMAEAKSRKKTIEKLYCYESITIRRRKNNRTGWPVELKIHGLSREYLDYLIVDGETADYLKESRELQPA